MVLRDTKILSRRIRIRKMYDVVIIGAGLAGLMCAYELRRMSNVSICIVEACSGVRTDRMFSKIEDRQGKIGYYYFGNTNKWLRYDKSDPTFQHAVLKSDYLKGGMTGTMNYSTLWKGLGNVEIRTSWKVTHVYWQPKRVILTSETGEMIYAKRVVFTPSIAVMKSECIEMSPIFTERRMRIYRDVTMEPCLKMAIRFSKRIWKEDFQGVICADSAVPEFWTIKQHILMGVATGRFAVALGELSRTELKERVLEQLDRMFGGATEAYVDMYQEWTVVGCVTKDDQEYIASSVDKTLFFAAMNTEIESSVRVAHEIVIGMLSKL